MSFLRPESLHYALLNPNAPGAQAPLLAAAFRCWKQVWAETLKELDGIAYLPSDDFTRQDEVGALFSGDRCVGLSCYRWVDLSLPFAREDSYFTAWPSDALDALVAHGPRVCIGSQISVPREFRGRFDGTAVKDLLLAFAVKRFLASDADVMTGTMRNNRNMNTLGYRLGGQPLVEDAELHGVKVDLLAFYRSTLTPTWTDVETSVWAGTQLSGGLP